MAEHTTEGWPPVPDRPWRVSERVIHLLAPNAGFMSYEGTNTWIVGDRGEAVVVDVGTSSTAHRDAILATADDAGWRITQVFATHGHGDHSDGARELADAAGAVLRSSPEVIPAELKGSRLLAFDEPAREGDLVRVGDTELRVLWTPGHSSDSISLHLAEEGFVLTGDTVLGGHSGAVFGGLRAYLDSLGRLAALADADRSTRFLPGHGPLVTEPLPAIDRLVAGRMRRVNDVRAVLERGITDADDIVDELYPGRVGHERMPALVTVQTLLEYLEQEVVDSAEHAQ